jgi:hypothetical protein
MRLARSGNGDIRSEAVTALDLSRSLITDVERRAESACRRSHVAIDVLTDARDDGDFKLDNIHNETPIGIVGYFML